MHESEKWKWSRSVKSDPQRPHGLQPSRLLRPWDFPGESTGVGCHCLLQKVAQSYPILCDSMDCSLPGSSVSGILQAKILEWVAIPFSKGSSKPRDRTQVSPTAGRFFIFWATRLFQTGAKIKDIGGCSGHIRTHKAPWGPAWVQCLWQINYFKLTIFWDTADKGKTLKIKCYPF